MNKTNFDVAFEKTLNYEGVLSNDKNDKGGLTKYGISKASYPKLDIANLTIEEAKAIYKRDYWDSCMCDGVNDSNIAQQIFDIAVNCGTGGAGQVVQKAINSLVAKENNIAVDGAIGMKTLYILNELEPKKANNKIAVYRARRYAVICQKNPSQLDFLEGWLVRTFGYIV
jgi:lysozyme family protein